MNTQLEQTLAHLVAIPSTPDNKQACYDVLTYVRDELAPYNLHIRGDFESANPWFIATTLDTNTPDILLAAHLDVVPAKEYRLEKQDDKFYGRGIYDMKLAAACYLEFFRSHADKLANLNIGLLFTTDEEMGGPSIPSVLATGLRPKVVFIPDGGDNWHIEERAKGFYHARLTAQGVASHGSRPWEGDNAIHRLLNTLYSLHLSFPSGDRADATLSVTTLTGGNAHNQTPDHASATIDFRSFSIEDLARYKDEVAQLVKQNNLELEVIQSGDPLILNKQSPAIQSFLTTLKEQTNRDVNYAEAYGATDGRFFAAYDIPCIIIEPEGGMRHADTEWLKASDLPKFYELIEKWLLRSN